MPASKTPMQRLLNTLPQQGEVHWIGVRPGREQPMTALAQVHIELTHGLKGDRFSGRAASSRQVTLIQREHLAVIAACIRGSSAPNNPSQADATTSSEVASLNAGLLDPGLLRRNIVVGGINLLALKDKNFQLGEVMLEYTGLCHPCSKMERLLGPGGYNAMRGHGGITARVLVPGLVRLNDAVSYAEKGPQEEER